MNARLAFYNVLLCMLVALSACQPSTPEPTSTPIPSPLPTQTAAPTASPTPALPSLVFSSPAWEGVQLDSLCLEIDEQYDEPLPFSSAESRRDQATGWLEELGFEVAPGNCDATLTVALGYSAIHTEYTPHNGGSAFDCLTGANAVGLVILRVPGRPPLYADVNALLAEAPTVTTGGCPDQDAAFDLDWGKTVLAGFSRLMGPQVITSLYGSHDKQRRSVALAASDAFGPEDADVAALVVQAFTDHKNGPYDLQLATGIHNLGPDAQKAAAAVVPGLAETIRKTRENVQAPELPIEMFIDNDVEVLGQLGPGAVDAVPLLIEILQDPTLSGLHSQAIIALGEIGPSAADAIPTLQTLAADAFLGSDATEALGKVGAADAEVVLFLVEQTKNPGSRLAGVHGLSKMSPSSGAVQALIGIVQDEDMGDYTRGQAIDALGAMAPESDEALSTLLAASQNANPATASAAIRGLGTLGPLSPEILPILKKALSSPDDAVRGAAASGLGNFGPEAVDTIPALIAMTEDVKPFSVARAGAIEALGRIGQDSPEAVSALAAALETAPSESVLALERLGFGAEAAVPALIEALQAENANPTFYGFQAPYVRALVAITGEYHGFQADDWQAWWDAR